MKQAYKHIRNMILFVVCAVSIQACSSIYSSRRIKDCTFKFVKISKLAINGVGLQDKKSFKDFSPADLVVVSKAIMTKKLNLTFDTHLTITNPNSKKAVLSNFDWIIEFENLEIAKGSATQSIDILPQNSTEAVLSIKANCKELLKTHSLEELSKLIFTFTSKDGVPKNIKLKIRPSIQIGSKAIPIPNYFEVPL